MRILLLTPQRPYPPHQGTTLRNFNLVKELAKRHTVCVLTFLEPDQQPDDSGPLPELCEWLETVPVPRRSTALRLGQMVTTGRPDMSWRLWSTALNERLAQRLTQERFDVIEIEGIEMSPYLSTIETQARPKPLIIYDAHNAECSRPRFGPAMPPAARSLYLCEPPKDSPLALLQHFRADERLVSCVPTSRSAGRGRA